MKVLFSILLIYSISFTQQTFGTLLQSRIEDPSIYCVVNDAETFNNFYPERYVEFLQIYTSICIGFSQVKHSDESDELANRRMKNFEALLQKAGIDTNRVSFNYDFLELHESDTSQLPRIEASVTGFDCE